MLRAAQDLGDAPQEAPRTEGALDAPAADPSVEREGTLDTESAFQDVLREVTRGQTRALMIEYLASRLVDDFAAHGSGKPKMLLRLPNTGAFPADLDDVFQLNNDLLGMAGKARARVRQLLRSRVAVPTAPPIAGSFSSPLDPAEGVVDNSRPRPQRRHEPDDDWSGIGGDASVRADQPAAAGGIKTGGG